jgi:zinc protease
MTILRRATAGLLLLAGVVHAQDAAIPRLAIESYKLPNGLKVALHRDPNVPMVTVGVAYHVGSKNERAGRTGFAHFFEHMMFRGTKNVPNYDIPLQETGAQSNAFTNEDMTVYFETVASEYLERALYLEAERLGFLPSALDQNKFDTEREVVKNERRQSYENQPYGLSEETILANLYPEGHPYSWSTIGSMKDLSAATLDDLKAFFSEFYHPGNATLIVAGDFEIESAKRLIEKYFAPLTAGEKVVAVVRTPVPAVAKRVRLADRVQIPRVYWNWPTVPDDHPDAPALETLAQILARGEASRLERRLVRELQVASDVAASSETREIAGLFQIRATAAQGKSIEQVEQALAAELERLKTERPTQRELDRAKAGFEKSSYTRLTTTLARAIAIGLGFAQHGDPEHYRKEIERHLAVTTADLERVVKAYFPAERVVVVVEPLKPGEEQTPATLAGPTAGSQKDVAAVDRAPSAGPDWSRMPGPAEPHSFQPPRFEKRRLANGMELWVAPWKTLPLVSAQILFPFGTGDDPAGRSGLADLTTTVLTQGTSNRTSVDFAESLELLGSGVGAGADLDKTTVGFSTTKRNWKPVLSLVAEMLKSPRFDASDFDREKQLQLTGLVQGPDEPNWIAQRAYRAVLYGPDHPYGRPDDGTKESVAAIELDDVKNFARKSISPAHGQIIIAGDVDVNEVARELEEALGDWSGSSATPAPRPSSNLQPDEGVVYLVDKPGAVQSLIRVGRLWRHRTDPNRLAAELGNHVVGVDFLSRLNANLREKNGFSYGCRSLFSYRRNGSVWVVATAVRADATGPALREIHAELDAVRQARPLTDEELATARSSIAKSFPEAFESPMGITGALVELAEFRLPDDELSTFLERLANTTGNAVREEITTLVEPPNRVSLVVGDRKLVEKELRALPFVKEIRLLDTDGKPVAKSAVGDN